MILVQGIFNIPNIIISVPVIHLIRTGDHSISKHRDDPLYTK